MKNILTISYLLFFSTIAISCTCNGVNSVKSEVRESNIVVIGTVISKNAISFIDSTLSSNKKIYLNKYSIVVNKIYKGKASKDTLTIYTGPSSASCGFNFMVGEKYIVYGNRKSYYPKNKNKLLPNGKNIFWTHQCKRTTIYNELEKNEIEAFFSKK